MIENIGFYTLTKERVKTASDKSPLMRCELILTDKCNFKCPYCRGIKKDYAGELPFEQATETLKILVKDGLKNVRFSGGEPTTYPKLIDLVKYCKKNKVNRIALSTNGSANLEYYKNLSASGVNDFSISLDACCASGMELMSGGVNCFDILVNNIKELSKITYVTVGVVINKDNYKDLNKIVSFASSLGVSDIRIISSAQENMLLEVARDIPKDILGKHPILKYRVNNILKHRSVRGIRPVQDTNKCFLGHDDQCVVGGYQFPCIIYFREGGNPIGKVGPHMREEKNEWVKKHNSHSDPICSKNCLDVCIDYNNEFYDTRIR